MTTTPILEQVLASPQAEKEAILHALQQDLKKPAQWKHGDPTIIDGRYTEAYAEELRRRIATLDDSVDMQELIDRL